MECAEAEEMISAYLDGRAADCAPDVEAHLAGCASCSRTLAELRAISAALAEMPEPPWPEGFEQRLREKLFLSSPRPRFRWGALGAAAALVLAVSYGGYVAGQMLGAGRPLLPEGQGRQGGAIASLETGRDGAPAAGPAEAAPEEVARQKGAVAEPQPAPPARELQGSAAATAAVGVEPSLAAGGEPVAPTASANASAPGDGSVPTAAEGDDGTATTEMKVQSFAAEGNELPADAEQVDLQVIRLELDVAAAEPEAVLHDLYALAEGFSGKVSVEDALETDGPAWIFRADSDPQTARAFMDQVTKVEGVRLVRRVLEEGHPSRRAVIRIVVEHTGR